MDLNKGIRKGFRAFTAPEKESTVNFSIKDALKFYYPFALFGFVIAFVAALVMQLAGLPITSSLGLGANGFYNLSWSHFAAMAGSAALVLFVLVPIGFFIDAAIVQLVGKFFLRVWNGLYSKTLVAYAFAALPTAMFYWLTLFSTPGLVLFTVFGGIWSFIMLVVALASQQKVSRLRSLGVLLAMMAIVLLIVFVITFTALAFSLPALLAARTGAV